MTRRVPTLALVLGLLLLVASALPVLGHVGLVRSDPVAGAVVSDVDVVTLVFDEALKAGASSFKLVGPDGATIGTGTPVGPRRMALDGLALQPGTYTVKWTAAGNDGHIERGRFSFTLEVAVATGAPAAASQASTPVASEAAAALSEPTASPAATRSAATAATGTPAATPAVGAAPASASGMDVLIPILVGGVVVVLVGLLVLRRSRTA